MIRLSAVIITYNEEKNIARCIASLQGVADEIIVADSFSTDQTATIATSMGARVVQHPFVGYAAQKNHATTLASSDWILSLDADEELTDILKQSILSVKRALLNWCTKYPVLLTIAGDGYGMPAGTPIIRRDCITALPASGRSYAYMNTGKPMRQLPKWANWKAICYTTALPAYRSICGK